MRRICNGIAGARKIFLVAVLVSLWIVGGVGADGLVAEYHFEGDVLDSSGKSNNGINHGGVFEEGVSGTAIRLDGENDYVEVLNSESLKINDSVSISLWFKTEKRGNQAIIHKSSSHDFDNYWVRFSPSNKDIYWDYGYVNYADINPIEIKTNEWYHLLVTVSAGGTGKIYINGQEATKYAHQLDAPGKLQVDNNPTEIGKDFNGNYFKGMIDEVRIYDRVLSPDEVEHEYDSPGGSGGGNGGPVNETCNNGVDDDGDGQIDWEDEDCIGVAKQNLLENLNSNNHFYEEYYDYDDNAPGPDIIKENISEIESNDIWIKCTENMCYYPLKATLIGPQIGFDANVWYGTDNPAGINSLELEVDATNSWLKEIPVVGGEVQGIINDLLGAVGEWSLGWDGVYYQAPIEWQSVDSKAAIPYKSSVQAMGPTFKNGLNAGTSGRYFYVAPSDSFDEELPSEVFLDMGLGMPLDLKGLSYDRSFNNIMGVLSYNLTVEFGGDVSPTLNAGDKIRFGAPRANLIAGKSLIDLELSARMVGDMCIMDECKNVDAFIPLPNIQPVTIVGENVLPLNDFKEGEFVEAIYENPEGNYVRYFGLDSFSPVIRLAASPVVIDYNFCFDLGGFNISCGGFLEPPCRVCPFQGNLINTDPWQDYWSFTQVRIHSPVDVHIYDGNGNHIGINSVNETETEVPYSQFNITHDGEKIVIFPTTAEKFIVLLNGTDSGNYSLEISRPIMVRKTNGEDMIIGISYNKTQEVEKNMVDMLIFDFEVIENYVNEQVLLGLDIEEAINDSFVFVDYRHDIDKMPSGVYLEDSSGYVGDNVILNARLMSLDRALVNKRLVFKVDGSIIGTAITNTTGWAQLSYINLDLPLGKHTMTAVFEGDEEIYDSTGKASLEILNSPPRIELSIPGIISDSTLIEGTYENDCEPVLKIDGVALSSSLPFLWNISEYDEGVHIVELFCTDTSGQIFRDMKMVQILRSEECGVDCPDDEGPWQVPEFPLTAIPLFMSLGGYLLLRGNRKGG